MTDRFSHIKAVAERHVSSGALSGIEWNIQKNGREWATGSAGMADGSNNTAMPDAPIYRIYSMTKPVVSAIALMLMEQGKLRLFDPLAAYLPEFAKMQVLQADGSQTRAGMITIEHLFTHRAGFSYGFVPGCPVGALYRKADLRDAKVSLENFCKTIATLPLAFQPGTEWRYSVATDVLGRVLEVILQKPLQAIVAEYVLDPLGLTDTGFMVPKDQRHRVMPMFGKMNLNHLMQFDAEPQTLIPADPTFEHPCDDPNFVRGGMGLLSTLSDYTKIARFLASGLAPDNTRLLARNTMQMMWQDRIPAAQKPIAIGPFVMGGYGWGLAGRVMADMGGAMIPSNLGECGWAGAASTFFWIDPVEDIIGVVMTQYLGSKIPIGEDFMTAVYQALDE